MFDAYSQRQRDRRPGIAIACIAVGVIACVLVLIHERGKHRERDDAETLNAALAMAPEPVGTWHPLALPGMSLEVPDELVVTGDYSRGIAQSMTWAVSWQPGSMPPADVIAAILEQMAVAVHGSAGKPSPITLLGQPGYEAELVLPTGATIVTFTVCGGRVVQLIGGPTRELVEHARASMRCTPKADAQLSDRIAVELRPGWHRTKADGPLALANDRDGVLLSISAQDATDIDVAAVARTSHFEVATVPEMHGRYAVRRGTLTTDGTAPAAIVTWRCPDQPRSGMIFVAVFGKGELEKGIDLAETGHCLAPGEAMPDYPGPTARPNRAP